MLEGNKPGVDVDELAARIKREAARRRGETPADISSIEDLLYVAEARAAARARLPAAAPFALLRFLRFEGPFLRLLAVVSGDQRRINLALIAALRALLAENRALAERLDALETNR
jgi:hypothetical protein